MTLSTEASTSEEASPQLSPVEATKASSAHLRGSLNDELADPTSPFSHDAGTLLKFHGIYAQDDRDQRRARTTAGDALAYSCMVRCSVPGGRLRPEQWFAIDRLADEVSDGSLRLTTRQGVQYHFIHKGELRPLISSLNRNLVTTYAACGDVVRNVMASAAPDAGRDPERIESLARAHDIHVLQDFALSQNLSRIRVGEVIPDPVLKALSVVLDFIFTQEAGLAPGREAAREPAGKK